PPPQRARHHNPITPGFAGPPANRVGTSVTTPIRHQPAPIQHQWTANLQRQLTSTLVVEAAYSGSRGEHFWQEHRFNAANPIYLALGTATAQQVTNPFFGKIATGTLSAPTVAARQLLLPYPQYTSITL